MTSQIPDLVDGLNVVADRIDRLWEADGADYPFGDEPDDNDPAVILQRRIEGLEFHDRVAANLPEVLTLLTLAENSDDAMDSLAPLLSVDEIRGPHSSLPILLVESDPRSSGSAYQAVG